MRVHFKTHTYITSHSKQTRCPMCSMASAILLSMSSSELDNMFSRAVRACFPPLSPCAAIMAFMTSSQPRFFGSFDNHSLMYSMSFSVTHNQWNKGMENSRKDISYTQKLRSVNKAIYAKRFCRASFLELFCPVGITTFNWLKNAQHCAKED